MSVTGTASDDNIDTVWINDTSFGTNLGTYGNWNFTNSNISEGSYSLRITANDTAGNEKTAEVHFSVGVWEVTFDVKDSYSGTGLNAVTIECDLPSFSQDGDNYNPYGPYEFPQGSYSCNFTIDNYYDKTLDFNVNNDTTFEVIMHEEAGLSIEEHTWLEYLYDCWSSGGCRESLNNIETMVIYINQTTTQINETVNKVWNQFKQTDEDVVLQEETTSTVVNETSNLTIEYSLSIPEKEDYQFLPVRIFYWFLSEDNTTCYGQAKSGEDAESPYCKPLVANAIGEINNALNFTVELRPSLPEGTYTVVRRIDIDPDEVWINYGHEAIGKVEVTKSTETNEISASVRTASDRVSGSDGEAGTSTGSVTGLSIGEMFNPMAVSMALSVVTLLAVAYLVVSRKK